MADFTAATFLVFALGSTQAAGIIGKANITYLIQLPTPLF